MAIDWRDKTPGAPNARPRIDPVTTLLAVDGLRVTEGEHAGEMAQVTRTFRSWSRDHDGEHHAHVWAEDIGLGWYYDDETLAWAQYDLSAHCASLPRHDERGVYTHANPGATVDDTPLGRNPNWGN